MNITRKDIIKARVEFLKDMNRYIILMDDDAALWDWSHGCGLGYSADENDFYTIATDNDLWSATCDCFGMITCKNDNEG